MFYQLFRSIIFLQDPEKAHERVIRLGKFFGENNLTNFLKTLFNYEDPRLNSNVCGIDFKNPIGLAAGFDKNAVFTEFIEGLDFGFEEIGSATFEGGGGNEKPRLFRLVKDNAIINRMGLNNHGAHEINKNLTNRKSKIPIGVNIAKTHSPKIMGDKAIKDFSDSYKTMTEGDYLVLNVSCPNTLEGKTFEDPGALRELLAEINSLRISYGDTRPLFAKLSSDVDNELSGILQVCEDEGIGGYVLSNSSSKRESLRTSQKILKQIGMGGLSGKPIREKSTKIISRVYQETKKPIIGVGGIFTGEDAYDKIKSGAVVLELLTGLIYEGPWITKKINKGLVKLLEREGFKNISEAVGVYHK
ncbi:MAG: quinone-dependent dihydroorotate dehydrogenase [Nanoarchaeota archaeon]